MCAPAVGQSHTLRSLYRWSKLFWASPWFTQWSGPLSRTVILLPLAQTGRELNSDVEYSQGFRVALPLVGMSGIEPPTYPLSGDYSTAELHAKKL